MTASQAARFRRALLRWYRAQRRDLPWRRSRDPYAIWISETMLQQTRVDTAIPYYERFLEHFPDVKTLASAEVEDVYQQWAGLGYYARARNLHRAARVLVDEHGGRLPEDATSLAALPGIGRYTAGAVASIAFDRPEPVVDGNVTRVLSRLLGIRKDVGGTAVRERLWTEAGALARSRSPGDVNQALMELGAKLCTPRNPQCTACPLRATCSAHARGDAESLPVKRPTARPRPMALAAVWLVRRGSGLMVYRPPGGLLGGLWELPGGELRKRETPARGLRRALAEQVGLSIAAPEPLGQLQHAFTHRALRLHLFRCAAPTGRVRLRGPERHRWLPEHRALKLALGAPSREALRRIASTCERLPAVSRRRPGPEVQ